MILKASIDSVGYPVVGLNKEGNVKTVRVHRLVAEAFIPNPENFRVINHIDSDKTNNRIDNLEWCTHRHNTIHAVNAGSFNKTMRKVRVVETGKIYPSVRECARQLSGYKVDYRHVSACLRGKLKSHAGFHFESVEE